MKDRNDGMTDIMKGFATQISCEYCKRRGHSIKECWKKNPSKRTPNNNSQKRGTSSSKQPIVCWGCNKTGHYERQCWIKHPELKKERNKQGIAAAVLKTKQIDSKPIYLDSACSCHLIANLHSFDQQTLHKATATLVAVGGHNIHLTLKGNTHIETVDGPITLTNAYYAEGLEYSLISIPELVKQGVRVYLDNNQAYIQKGRGKINLINRDGLWTLPTKPQETAAALRMERGNTASTETWHRRLGHISTRKMTEMANRTLIPKHATNYDTNHCTVCNLTKPLRRPVPTKAESSGEITVQVDYMPVGVTEKGWRGEVGAYIYSLRKSKLIKAYGVKDAGVESAVQTLKNYVKDIIPYVNDKITCVQTDAGSQFTSHMWEDECKKHGLIYRTCPIDHQAMNGQVERVVGIMATMVRTMIRDQNVPEKYWPLALDAATYIYNRTVHSTLEGLTPFEKGTGRKPDLSKARIFGCQTYVQTPKNKRRGKFQDTAWSGVMVGYSTTSLEWIIMDPRTNTLRKAYSVTFNEIKSGFKNDSQLKSKEIFLSSQLGPDDTKNKQSDNERQEIQTDSDEQISTDNNSDDNNPEVTQHCAPDQRGTQVQEDQLQHLGACMALKLNDKLPRTWKQAMQEPHWFEAMEREVEELRAKDAWILVDRTQDMRVLPGVWAFRIKKRREWKCSKI